MPNPHHLTFVAKAPVPFHEPILEAVRSEVGLSVLYVAERRSQDYFDDRRRDHFGRTVPSIPLYFGDPERAPRWPIRLGAELNREQPSAVLLHSWDPAMWPALAWSRRRHVRTVMWLESTRWSGKNRSALADLARRQVLRQVDAFVANGTEARMYAVGLGVPPERISAPLYPIDAKSEQENPTHDKGNGVASGDRRLHVLFVGRLIRRKRAGDVIAACHSLARRGPAPRVRIVGGGPEEDDLEMCTHQGLDIEFRGWREGAALSAEYDWADVLVVPSEREVWGLVVNEALDHGCYVLASDQVGAARDLLCDPALGRIFPAGSTEALSRLLTVTMTMDRFASARKARRALAHRLTPGAFDPKHFAGAVLAAAFPDTTT